MPFPGSIQKNQLDFLKSLVKMNYQNEVGESNWELCDFANLDGVIGIKASKQFLSAKRVHYLSFGGVLDPELLFSSTENFSSSLELELDIFCSTNIF